MENASAPFLDFEACFFKKRGIGPAKSVDGLARISHNDQPVLTWMMQKRKNAPLERIDILKFVHDDPAEMVLYLTPLVGGEEFEKRCFQVVKIKKVLRLFSFLIPMKDFLC